MTQNLAAPSPLPDGCLGCARLEDGSTPLVTLLSGQQVCSWCQSWKLECAARELDARSILRLAYRDDRLARLASLEAKHGAEYRRRLERVVLEIWERRRSSVKEPA